MEVFKFNNPRHPMLMESGQLINGLTRKTWIERYGPAGEFTFVAPLRTGIRENLPIGSFVSHMDTREIMCVDNHEITARKNEEPEVTVTGSSFETIFDQRIVGGNKKLPSTDIQDYHVEKGFFWHQLINLIRNHIDIRYLVDPDNEIPHVDVSQVVDQTGYVTLVPALDRLLARGTLYEHIQDFLKPDNLGIRSVRPVGDGTSSNTLIQVHRGIDRTGEVIFRYDAGEIDDLDYLFSRKKLKNCALVTGTWVEIEIVGTETKEDRRWMHVSATDIDQDHESVPEGEALELVQIALWYRGMQALVEQINVALQRADISRNALKYQYRKDYDLGDLVSVGGGFVTKETDHTHVRVIEHVETEDENGYASYPTLALDPPQ